MRRTERKYSEEQIAALKKRLAALEEKDSGKTREEVVKDLEKSFRAAMRKGYSLKEISELCLQEEIFIPIFRNAYSCKKEKKRRTQRSSFAGNGGVICSNARTGREKTKNNFQLRETRST